MLRRGEVLYGWFINFSVRWGKSFRQGELKAAAPSVFSGFDPDFSFMFCNNPFYQGQAKAAAVAVAVELFEQAKDLFVKFSGDSGAVIADVKNRFRDGFQTDVNMGVFFCDTVGQGIVNQVLPDLQQV